MSPVLSGGTMSIPICETIAGAPRRLFIVAPAQLVAGTTMSVAAAMGRVVKLEGTRLDARAKSTGPTPTNSVHAEKVHRKTAPAGCVFRGHHMNENACQSDADNLRFHGESPPLSR
jgi:hypothetical protein